MHLLRYGVLLPFLWAASHAAIWHVDSPRDGTRIHSPFVVLAGTAPDGECARISSADPAVQRICSVAGEFHRILHLPPGRSSIEVKPEGLPAEEDSRIEIAVESPSTSSLSEVHWERLRIGDVVLSRSIGSQQADLYDAVFTHAGLYYGPSADGVPLIAEAVGPDDAEGLGEVRTVPIEQSFPFRRGENVAILRPAQPLTKSEQQELLEFLGRVVNKGLRYWSAAEDFSNMYSAWILWNPRADRPRDPVRFERIVHRLESSKLATDRFTCASLVWRAYWTATGGRVDLATPNRAEIGGRLGGAFTPGFLARVRPYFISPDSLYRSGKLVEVQE